MAFVEELSDVQVLYQLSWEGKLEHPHMITVQYPSNQDGLRLRGKFPSSMLVYTLHKFRNRNKLCKCGEILRMLSFFLADVKRRLTTLRGQGIDHSFSWSYKRFVFGSPIGIENLRLCIRNSRVSESTLSLKSKHSVLESC